MDIQIKRNMKKSRQPSRRMQPRESSRLAAAKEKMTAVRKVKAAKEKVEEEAAAKQKAGHLVEGTK